MTAGTEQPGRERHPNEDGAPRLWGSKRASEAEIARRATLSREQTQWNTTTEKGADVLRVATLNAANHLRDDARWLPLRAAAVLGVDVAVFQETGGDATNEKWIHDIKKETRAASGRDAAVAKAWSSHQSAKGRWVGGVAAVASGEMAKRCTFLCDLRGWGRYGIAKLTGVAGRAVLVVTVYTRDDAETDGDDAKTSTILRQRARSAPHGVTTEKWKPGEIPPRPTTAQVEHPAALMWSDIRMHLAHWATDERATIVIAGDFNNDPVRGDAGGAELELLCEELHVQHAAVARHGVEVAREITTRRGGHEGARPSHIDHVLVTEGTQVLSYFVDDATVASISDHAMVVLDLDLRQALGVTDDGKRVPEAPGRWVAATRSGDKTTRDRFTEFAAAHYEKHTAKHGIDEARRALAEAMVDAKAATEQAVHTADWQRDRRRSPLEAETLPPRGGRQEQAEGPAAVKVREALGELAQALDGFARAADTAYTSSGKQRRRPKWTPGRGRAERTVQLGRLWTKMKDARLRGVHGGTAAILAALEEQVRLAAKDAPTMPSTPMAWLEQNEPQAAKRIAEAARRSDAVTMVREVKEAEGAFKKQLHSRERVRHTMDAGGPDAEALRKRTVTIQRRHVNRLLERSRPGRLDAIAVEEEDGVRILRDPAEQARHTADFATPRFSTAQGKVFIRTDVREGDVVHLRGIVGRVKEARQDGKFTVTTESGEMTAEHGELDPRNPDGTARGEPTDTSPERDAHALFRRTAEGAAMRQRLVDGRLTDDDRKVLPAKVRELERALRIRHFRGRPVRPSDYRRLFDDTTGKLRAIAMDEWTEHLKRAVKGKSPGYSGVTTDVIVMMPAAWHEAAVDMINASAATGISPSTWQLDLVNYIHKGGPDMTLGNHRPIKLLDQMRKLLLGIIVGRLQADWNELGILSKVNSGFHAGRGTGNALLPARAALEQARRARKVAAVMYDDLKWAFDTPARAVLDLTARRLGMPTQLMELLEDIDTRSTQTTVLAAGLAMDLDVGGVFRQLHGTGQGGIEGPALWLTVADVAIAKAEEVDARPIVLSTPGGWTTVGKEWFVDDSCLMQVAETRERAVESLETMVNATGLVYAFLGLERRPKKCHLVVVGDEAEPQARVECKHWLASWQGEALELVQGESTYVRQQRKGKEVRYLGLTDDEKGNTVQSRNELVKIARRAAAVYRRQRSLRGLGEALARGVIAPKVAYPMVFSMATRPQLEAIEQAYGSMVRQSLGMRAGTAWDVLESPTGQAGAGYERLTTTVAKGRLRELVTLMYGGTEHEAEVATAIIEQGQRWMGGPEHILDDAPDISDRLDAEEGKGPWIIGLAATLGRLNIAITTKHKCRGRTEKDEPIMQAAKRRLGERAEHVQRWRRRADVYWMSEILDLSGKRLTARAEESIERLKQVDAEGWRAVTEAFCGAAAQAMNIGRPTTAAWAAAAAGRVMSCDGGLELVIEVVRAGVVVQELCRDTDTTTRQQRGQSRWTVTGEPWVREPEGIVVWADAHEFDGVGVVVRDADAVMEAATTDLAEDPSAAWGNSEGPYSTADGAAVFNDKCATFRHFEWYYRAEAATERPLAVAGVPLRSVPEVVRAARELRKLLAGLSAQERATWANDAVMIYSDGSVEGAGVIGAAAIAIRVGETTVKAAVRVATFDEPLSSNRAEWTAAVMAIAVLTMAGVDENVELRLDNNNVVHDCGVKGRGRRRPKAWLQMQDRDLEAIMHAWRLRRRERGMGEVVVLHQPGHPERRKRREEFDEHEVMNDVVDDATHRCHPNQLVYGGFAAEGERFIMWVVPRPEEGLEKGKRLEVTGPPLRYMRKRAARLADRRRAEAKRGEFVSAHEAGLVGWTESARVPTDSIKFYQSNLPTEAVKNMYEGHRCRARCECGMLYVKQDHGFLWCTDGTLEAERALLVERQRETVERLGSIGAARAVVEAYATNRDGAIVRDTGTLAAREWIVEEWDPELQPTRADLGSAEPQTRSKGGLTWSEPAVEARKKLERAWGAQRDYDHGGLMAEQDVRAAEHERFARFAAVGGAVSYWTLRWTEMAVVHLARLAGTDVGETKQLIRAMRKNVEEWWRRAWKAWRRLGFGTQAGNEVERRGRMLEAWGAARLLLGADYRDAAGRRLPTNEMMRRWSWVSIGRQLRRHMTAEAKARITAALIENYEEGHDAWMALEEAGIRLDAGPEETSDEDVAIEGDTDDEAEREALRQLRTWESAGTRKRAAKEVAADEHATPAERALAQAWLDRASARNAKQRRTRRGAGDGVSSSGGAGRTTNDKTARQRAASLRATRSGARAIRGTGRAIQRSDDRGGGGGSGSGSGNGCYYSGGGGGGGGPAGY